MKSLNFYLLLIVALATTGSCGEDFLDETPLDFFSTENAFANVDDFNASVNNLYGRVRSEFFTVNDYNPMEYLYRTDVGFQITTAVPNLDADFSPNSGIISYHWGQLYKIVSEANTIISRAPDSELSEEQQLSFEAKARFFRAFAFRSLAYLYGGVPILTEELTGEKVDFVRASREEVYALVITDLLFAIDNLPDITEVQDGEVSRTVAQHLLAEVYLADGQFEEAMRVATEVIDNPATALMTERFGTRSTEEPGDVYWDLFRRNNQNRGAGNTEALWVIQSETDVLGGGAVSTDRAGSYQLERVHAPLIRDVQIDGVSAFLWPAGDYTGGRGVGFLTPSTYFIDEAYADDPDNDIRNANHNFVRKFESNNPASPYFGQLIDFHDLPENTTGTSGVPITSGVPNRGMYPYQSKATTPYNHPPALYENPGNYPWHLKNSAGGTYTDQYMFRLAGTYLLRAEAYLGMGKPAEAVADINVVRARSNAAAASAGEMDIDYILDERMREFGMEEKRMFTLMRLGKLYDRIKMCNPFYADGIQPYHNLWPIPASEIERNRGGSLEQNEGYN
ncbi:RagB/SusD family nutrient uptake outer membrane protein [Lewinella sp. IMCC34191]|uniref:RagB/SusD family nutrient uptake outer membrane protein n=1 Tax=Lewinella sp. IMCC34191 TaxID=2259172 RepID=UPI000E2646DD|nr:RagB/SusD family nutrient uptake outer membrane protein [Lewinella sp. IMCC34191]